MTRRRAIAKPEKFSLMDELMASPMAPWPAAQSLPRIGVARAAMVAMSSPDTANVRSWADCNMAGNIIETLIAQGIAEDPHGLLADAFAELSALARPGGAVAALPPASVAAVAAMIDDFADLLTQAPARTIVHAYRATSKRLAEIEAGHSQPHDFHIDTRGQV